MLYLFTEEWSKMKAFADNKMNMIQKLIFHLKSVKNIVGGVENAGNQHFLLSPQCFQEAFYLCRLRSDFLQPCGINPVFRFLLHQPLIHLQSFIKSIKESLYNYKSYIIPAVSSKT